MNWRCLSIIVILFFNFCIIGLSVCHGFAQNPDILSLEQVLQGFEEPSITVPVPEQSQGENQNSSDNSESFPDLNFTGSFSTHISYSPYRHTTAAGYSIHGLTSFKPYLALFLAGKLSEDWLMKISGWSFYDFAYTLQGRDNYSPEVLDNYEQEMELGEAYLGGRLSPLLDITVGRQIVVWGKSDFFGIANMVNPVDNRERGMDDIEIKRLPLWMTRLDAYLGPWRVSGLLTHELRYSKNPVYGHDFYPYDFPAPPREDRSNNLENSSFGISLERVYNGVDIGFYYGSFLKELDMVGLTSEVSQLSLNRLTLFSMAAEKAMDHWLFKMEAGVVGGLEYYSLPEQEKTRLDLLLGTDYTGFRNTRLSLEIINRHLFKLDSEVAERDDTPSQDSLVWAFRAARTFHREKLQFIFLSYVGGVTFSQGSVQSVSAEYEVNDSLAVTAGYVFIHSGDNYIMRDMGDNDRILLKLNYKF